MILYSAILGVFEVSCLHSLCPVPCPLGHSTCHPDVTVLTVQDMVFLEKSIEKLGQKLQKLEGQRPSPGSSWL